MRQVYRQKAQGTVTHKRDPQNNTGIGQDISNDERMPTESLQTRRQWNTLARVDRIMPVVAGQANIPSYQPIQLLKPESHTLPIHKRPLQQLNNFPADVANPVFEIEDFLR
ncbi:hypothetical protein J7T55_010982 [Diaporthe amygdali]|uniref:uncharacterized protein n=1 Tax=Phomopsis amygdali TaxID=1214568 RepID=UPI0022FDEB25|nr:uncharacterized protein J7T55_010982 [Diaporthe amygdali]KAJ0103965.1 hypothetical protein J7T55_010982 [Diaporthe amygdali]